MLKQIVVWTLLLIGSVVPLVGQSNQRIDELLSQAQARLDSASYLLMVSAGIVDESSDPLDAFEAAVVAGYLAKSSQPEDPVSIEVLSFLIMKTQKIPGGIGWMLFPGTRSAYRELAFHEVVNTSAGPTRIVAGDEVVRTLNGAVALKGGLE